MQKIVIILANICCGYFISQLIGDGNYLLAAAFGIIVVVLDLSFLFKKNRPYRWLYPAFVFTLLLSVFPFVYNVYISFTNYSQQHILTQQQAIKRIELYQYLPEESERYSWSAYYSSVAGDYCLLLIPQDSEVSPLFACQGSIIEKTEIGEQLPEQIDGYEQLSSVMTVQKLSALGEMVFGDDTRQIQIISLKNAGEYQQRYIYNEKEDIFLDQHENIIYSEQDGYYASEEGIQLNPGFTVQVGFANYVRLFVGDFFQGPLFPMLIWNILFAVLKVLVPFFVGLLIAIVLDKLFPVMKKIIRSMILLPYIIPAFISILIWRGLLNPQLGLVNHYFEFLFNWSPGWFTEPVWTKVALVLISLWLSFPYWVLICTGAIQAIPDDVKQAATVDGASPRQIFFYITLPYVLSILSPMLVFGFANSFNSFNLIYLFNKGGPPMSGTAIPVGHTDILLSYAYRLSFDMGGGDFAYGSSITFIIFLILTPILLMQWRHIMKGEGGIN